MVRGSRLASILPPGPLGDLVAGLTTLLAILALARSVIPAAWTRAARRMLQRLTNFLDPYVYYTVRA
jgi:hypothetical protein